MRWTVIEHAGRPVAAGPSALLAAPGGTIGRSPDNHLVLPDEQRQISRLQATVRYDDEGRAVLRNMSAVLPISVNGQTLRHDQESPIAEGDRVTIGSYVLEAAPANAATSRAAPSIATAAAEPTIAWPPAIEPASSRLASAPVSSRIASTPDFGAQAASLPSSMPPPAPAHPSPMPAAAPLDALLPQAPVSDVFADLFGAGALPIGDTHAAPPREVPAPQPVPPPVQRPPAPAPVAAPVFAPAPPPAFAPPPTATPSPFAVPAPAPAARSAMPTAADWDAILANAPRRVDSTPEPMPDPFAHEPFELPSQARRNPADPLAQLNPGATTDVSDFALKRGIDPLSLFAADQHAPSPLSDPRPTALTHAPALEDVHPAMDLLEKRPTVPGYSQSNHAREVSGQFRPPTPMPLPVAQPPARMVEPEPVREAAPAAPVAAPPTASMQGAPVEAALASMPTRAPATPAEAPLPAALSTMAPVAAPVVAPAPAVLEVPVEVVAPKASPEPVAVVAPPSPAADTAPALPAASCEVLFRAFLDGAGVPDVAGQQQLDAEMMRRLGRLMRAFTDGTIELLSSRAMLKREVRAEITMIVDEENNPFKILPNGRAVLMQMFGARMPGFLPPEAAVHDALGDLQSHQLGMVAGMRAALLMVLQRFDPEALKKDTPHDGGLGEKLLPGGREARLWRQLQQLHAETTAAVEDDFQAVFGRAFQQAYDREMERLKEARRA
ncbi:type VI secretion system-associated FHA domain protein TagH [Variovorax sp.]|jgi:FHA domain-containing protein|uniref:type VI secretion system-associated FHA domain protein TagH n=1 Tax=Variovorax sp. TaxID=1871043 RepID=UPI0037DA08BF